MHLPAHTLVPERRQRETGGSWHWLLSKQGSFAACWWWAWVLVCLVVGPGFVCLCLTPVDRAEPRGSSPSSAGVVCWHKQRERPLAGLLCVERVLGSRHSRQPGWQHCCFGLIRCFWVGFWVKGVSFWALTQSRAKDAASLGVCLPPAGWLLGYCDAVRRSLGISFFANPPLPYLPSACVWLKSLGGRSQPPPSGGRLHLNGCSKAVTI